MPMFDYIHDIRTRVPIETLSVIHALEIATGDTIAEITRKWIIAAAEKELHRAKVVCRVMNGNGNETASEGKT